MLNIYNSQVTSKICTVTGVDLKRKVCKCLSDTGEIISEVRWVVPMGGTDGTGASVHPVENSRVLIDVSSGNPFIIGAIPSDSADLLRRTAVGRQTSSEQDIADYSIVPIGEIVRGPGTPRDQRVGDNVITSDGGGIMGLLSSGTALIKSSPLAQIISSRLGDMVRIVSRNFEHFTDVDSVYKVSIRGKIFSIRHLFRDPSRSREQKPSLVRYEGDVAFGETIGPNYATIPKDEFPDTPNIPADSNLLAKEYTISDADEVTSTWTQSVLGYLSRTINSADNSSVTIQNDTDSSLSKNVNGGSTSQWHMDENEFYWNSGDAGNGVRVHGTAASGLTIQSANGAAKIVLNNDGTIEWTSGDVVINSGAVTWEAAGNWTLNAPLVSIN